MLIIGSTAIKHYYPNFPRIPKDLDIVVHEKSNFKSTRVCEYLVNPVILKYQDEGYLRPELMLSLKVSHMFWDYQWDKHLFDIQFLLKKDLKWDLDLVNELIYYWNIVLPKVRRSNLNMSKKEFFNNAINKNEHQHDMLHELLNPDPRYLKLLKEGFEVELDENKWNGLDFESKKDVIFEETAVMAFERYHDKHYQSSYLKQLKDNIIKHFPRYIALFAIEHYIVLFKPKFNFVKFLQEKI